MQRSLKTSICAFVLAVSPLYPLLSNAQQPQNAGDPLFTQRLTNPYGPPVSVETARKAAAAAIAEGRKNGWTVTVAVVDAGGVLVYFERTDGAQTASSDLAIQKARTASAFKRSTKLLQDRIVAGQLQYLSMSSGSTAALPIEGGVPLIEDGRIIGAIGVSGARSEQDGVCVKAAVEALAAERSKEKK